MKDDSFSGIYDTVKDCALISKYIGGIGLSIIINQKIKDIFLYISGTKKISNGLVPIKIIY